MFAQLVAFHRENVMPTYLTVQSGLGLWVARQRTHRNNPSRMTPARRERLNSIGFRWENEI